jgi:RNA polymerase sigma-70 factor (ECF subfamily)
MRRGKIETHRQFEKEMVPHMDQLYGYAFYLTGDREEANDLIQETYLKAYRFFDKFEQGTNAKAWLYRIMRNTYINEYRRVQRLPDMIEYDEQTSAFQFLPQPFDATNDLREKIDKHMFDDELTTAISGLPEKFKSVTWRTYRMRKLLRRSRYLLERSDPVCTGRARCFLSS